MRIRQKPHPVHAPPPRPGTAFAGSGAPETMRRTPLLRITGKARFYAEIPRALKNAEPDAKLFMEEYVAQYDSRVRFS
ncbi:MAG: hypothetical protein LBC53_07920 [Spirochaetaceae bacterium]|nr:hypothetical protein [Spirochaetaceae bacterium]